MVSLVPTLRLPQKTHMKNTQNRTHPQGHLGFKILLWRQTHGVISILGSMLLFFFDSVVCFLESAKH